MAYGFLLQKKVCLSIFLRQIEHIAHDDFCNCSLIRKLTYHSLIGQSVLTIFEISAKQNLEN